MSTHLPVSPRPTRPTARPTTGRNCEPAALAPRSREELRVREQVRDALALMVFSAFASTALAAVFVSLALLTK